MVTVLPKRFGAVAFGGIGIAPGGGELFRSSALLPAGGAGLRFMLTKSYHINLRADLAVGKNEYTFSMGIGEAFQDMSSAGKTHCRENPATTVNDDRVVYW